MGKRLRKFSTKLQDHLLPTGIWPTNDIAQMNDGERNKLCSCALPWRAPGETGLRQSSATGLPGRYAMPLMRVSGGTRQSSSKCRVGTLATKPIDQPIDL